MVTNQEEVATTNDKFSFKEWEPIYRVFSRVPMAIIFHPFEYAKILIQIGYEPIAPRPTRTLFGRPALGLPNLLEYAGYIRKQVGIVHMYRGVFPRMINIFTQSYVHEEVSKYLDPIFPEESEDDEDPDVPIWQRLKVFLVNTGKSTISQVVAVIASYPFQVITVRMVAQYIGGEEAYNWMFTSAIDIYKESGLLGFYGGLVPRILGEVFVLWMSASLTFAVNTYLISDKEMKNYTMPIANLIASSATYPYIMVSRVLMVNGSGMVASLPPNMPIYDGWIDCWSQLKAQNQLKRGSSLLWRYYTGPVVLNNGKPIPATLRNFQKPIASKYH